MQGPGHRRKKKIEAKAKVVASVWGTEFIKFLAALAVLPRTIMEISSYSIFKNRRLS